MAYSADGLSLMGHAWGHKVFHYYTNDDNAAVVGDGYFDGAYPEVRFELGDIIFASIDMDGTPYPYLYVVSSDGGDGDIGITGGPVSNAVSVNIADTGDFTSETEVEGALQEIYQHIASAKAYLNIPLGAFTERDGTALADFADGDSTTPGWAADAEIFGIRWNNHANPDPVATSIPLPEDLDAGSDVVVHIVAAKVGATLGDAVKWTCEAFNNHVGDLYDADDDYGGDSDAMTGDAAAKTVQECTLTLANANIEPAPNVVNFTIQPKDGTLGTDDVILLGVWLEYTRKILTA